MPGGSLPGPIPLHNRRLIDAVPLELWEGPRHRRHHHPGCKLLPFQLTDRPQQRRLSCELLLPLTLLSAARWRFLTPTRHLQLGPSLLPAATLKAKPNQALQVLVLPCPTTMHCCLPCHSCNFVTPAKQECLEAFKSKAPLQASLDIALLLPARQASLTPVGVVC